MRRLLRDVAEGRELGDVTTLQNAPILDEIRTKPQPFTQTNDKEVRWRLAPRGTTRSCNQGGTRGG